MRCKTNRESERKLLTASKQTAGEKEGAGYNHKERVRNLDGVRNGDYNIYVLKGSTLCSTRYASIKP